MHDHIVRVVTATGNVRFGSEADHDGLPEGRHRSAWSSGRAAETSQALRAPLSESAGDKRGRDYRHGDADGR